MDIDRLLIKGPRDNDFIPVDDEFGFYLVWRRLSAPEAKHDYADIAGTNGSYDGTEDYGEIFYNDRELALDCKFISSEWHEPYHDFLNRYHEQQCQIAFANDPDWYWSGRIKVAEYDAQSHTLSMTAQVYPYKFRKYPTIVQSNGNETVKLCNGRMRVVPTVTIDDDVTLKWGTTTKALQSSTYPATFLIAGLELTDGELDVEIVGDASVRFEYREGSL